MSNNSLKSISAGFEDLKNKNFFASITLWSHFKNRFFDNGLFIEDCDCLRENKLSLY